MFSCILLFVFLCGAIPTLCANFPTKDRDYYLGSALDEVLGALKKNRAFSRDNDGESSIRRRCSDYLACEAPIPGIEVENVAFQNGKMHVDGSAERIVDEINAMTEATRAAPGHLHSTMVQFGPAKIWAAGPAIEKSSLVSQHCAKYKNGTHALFLFPWEVDNTFHALNDNVLSVLANVIVHYLHTPAGVSAHELPRYTLYTVGGTRLPALLYELLPVIFGPDHVLPASTLLTKGPHCVRSLSWVSALKPFYMDTFIDMRRAIYDVLHHILRAYRAATTIVTPLSAAPALPTRQLRSARSPQRPGAPTRSRGRLEVNRPSPGNSADSTDQLNAVKVPATGAIAMGARIPGAPRLVIVTRTRTPYPERRITLASEQRLMRAYEQAGFQVEICCDFRVVNTIPRLLEHFLDVDVCVGLHGAGLSNCVFGRPGMVIVELQIYHGFGTPLFHKIAHMAGGRHLLCDIRYIKESKGVRDEGLVLPRPLMDSLATWTLRLHQYGKDNPFDPNEVIVVSPAKKVVYVQEPSAANMTAAVSALLGSSAYKLRSVTEWLAPPAGQEYLTATIPRNRGTYWIQLNPSSLPYTMESILGPKVSEVKAQCLQLPYHRFRHMALGPDDVTVRECDPAEVIRDPSTANVHQLLLMI